VTKPPQALIDRMLADGALGIWSSVIALGAALAVQRGGDGHLQHSLRTPTGGVVLIEQGGRWGDVVGPEGEQPPAAVVAGMRRVHEAAMAELRDETQEYLAAAIALYQEHLRQAGYCWSVGSSRGDA